MANYGASGSAAVGTNKANITIIGGTAVRLIVYDVVIGSAATPADQASRFQVQRFTASGTGAASPPTPEPLDSADVAALATTKHGAFTVEPTLAGKPYLNISLNQRATFRWVADPSRGFKPPATADNGIAVNCLSGTGSAAHEASIVWEE